MAELRDLQSAFFGHLLGQSSDITTHIQSTPDTSATQRLSIYASGYRLRLKEAITTDFECLHGYLGDALFDQLMDAYIDTYLSHHTSLRHYSEDLITLLETLPPFAQIPVLPELGKIEQTFNSSFDAADCTTVALPVLATVAPEAWPGLQLEFHQSLQIISCEWNSFDIWKALSEQQTPPAAQAEKNYWLIWRKELVSRYRSLDEPEARALIMMTEGAGFGELCEGLLSYFDEQETPQMAIQYLQGWIAEQMVCQLRTVPATT